MSLIAALELYTHIKGSPYTREALVAGLPLSADPMDFSIFERAAARAGLEVKQEKRELKDLFHFALPCILILNDNRCALVTKVTSTEATIIYTENWDESVTLSLNELSKDFSGEAIFLSHTLKPQSTYVSMFNWFVAVLKENKKLYVQAAISGGIVNIFLIITTFYALTVYDRVVPHQGYETLWVLTIGVIIIYLFDGILRVIRAHFIDQASKKADMHIGSELFEKILNTRMESRPASSAAMAFHLKEFESLREFLSSSTLVILSDLPYTFLLLLVIGMIGGYIVFVPIVAIVLILMISIFVQPSLSNYVKRLNQVSENKYTVLINSISNLELVKSFNMHSKIQTQWENVLHQSADLGNELKHFSHVISTATSFIQNVAYIFTIVVGVYLIGASELTFGGLIACSILLSRSLSPVAQLVGLIGRINQSIFSIRELSQIINMPQERRTDISYHPKSSLAGTVQFVNVDFSYPRQRLKSLRNFSLAIPSGNRIGLIGRIGSGKTTFEKLLMGLYQPSAGHILVDGIDLSQLDPFELRKHIGYVPQDVTLWRGTLKYNIVGGLLNVSEEQFTRACEIAGIMDFVRLHPLGFNMPISEDGSGLSGGQKQAVALARALLPQPKILLMDEPTASMDPQSEAIFLEKLYQHLTDQTVIIITHRMTVLKLVQRVVLIEQGQVVMDGPRDEVIARINQLSTPEQPQNNPVPPKKSTILEETSETKQ